MQTKGYQSTVRCVLTVKWRNVELAMRKTLFFDKSNSSRLSCPRKLFSVILVILFLDRSATEMHGGLDFIVSSLPKEQYDKL